MRGPLLVLAVPTVALGAVIGWLPAYLGAPLPAGSAVGFGPAPLPGTLTPQLLEALIAQALVVIGAGATYLMWRAEPSLDPARVLGRAAGVLRRGLYLDQIQDVLVVRPYRRLVTAVSVLDQAGVDGLVDGAASAASAASSGLSRAHPRLPNLAVTSLIISTVALTGILALFR